MSVSRSSKPPREQPAQQPSGLVRLSDGTSLDVGAVADGQVLTRSGTSIVGSSPASAGGNAGDVQFNNFGALGGASSTAVLGSGNLSHSREQEVKLISDPAMASSGYLHFYGASRGGRGMPAFRSSIGSPVTVQPSLFGRRFHLLYLITSGFQSLGNWAWQTVGASSARAAFSPTATTRIAASTRYRFVSSAAANTAAGNYTTVDVAMRGASSGCGGFFYYARFGLDATPGSGTRFFVGLTAQTDATTITTNEPSNVNNSVGLYKDSTTNNYGILCRGTAASTEDAGFAPANGDLIDVYVWAEPNGSSVSVAIYDVNAGTLAKEATFTTNLPANNVGLRAQNLGGPGSGTTAVQMCIIEAYLETDL